MTNKNYDIDDTPMTDSEIKDWFDSQKSFSSHLITSYYQ